MTLHRGRSAEHEITEHDKSQLRALLGSIQGPAVQTTPHLQCSCSLISGKMAQNKLQAVVDDNSLLRLAEQNADTQLQY